MDLPGLPLLTLTRGQGSKCLPPHHPSLLSYSCLLLPRVPEGDRLLRVSVQNTLHPHARRHLFRCAASVPSGLALRCRLMGNSWAPASLCFHSVIPAQRRAAPCGGRSWPSGTGPFINPSSQPWPAFMPGPHGRIRSPAVPWSWPAGIVRQRTNQPPLNPPPASRCGRSCACIGASKRCSSALGQSTANRQINGSLRCQDFRASSVDSGESKDDWANLKRSRGRCQGAPLAHPNRPSGRRCVRTQPLTSSALDDGDGLFGRR